ncbi:MAG: 2-hydroxyacyl-CoA dehydratase [archaeon]|nr:2-hydroxyacyl-CoA dehydratase [archaeon]
MQSLIYEDSRELFTEYYQFLQEQKLDGKKIIGYFAHEFIPDEIISAAGAIPVPLILAGDEERTTIGSDLLTPTMCPYALSQIGTFELHKDISRFKFLSLIDGIIATNYCAADILVNEWISEKYDITFFKFHIPFLQRESHVLYFQKEIEKLASEICRYTGKEILPSNLIEEIKKYDIHAKIMSKISNSKIKGSEKVKIIQKLRLFGPHGGNLLEFDEINKKLDDYLKKHSEEIQGYPIILAGCSVFIEDEIIQFIEDCGGNVIFDSTWLGNAFYVKDYKEKIEKIELEKSLESIYQLISEKFAQNDISLRCSTSHNPLSNYIENISSIAYENKTKAIIYHIIKFCDITGHHRDEIKNQLNDRGFQVLQLERDYSKSTKGQLKTRIEAFVEMIR